MEQRPASTAAPLTTRAVLRRNPAYRLVAASMAVSGVGDWMFGLALAVWILERTHSPGWVVAGVALRMAPYALLGSLGGVVADRYDRRRVLIAFDIVRGFLLVAMTLVMMRGGPVVLAIALAAATAVATVPYRPATVAIVPQLVARDDIGIANALEAAINHTMLFAGPALAAFFLHSLSPATVIALDAATFVVSAALLTRLPQTPHERTTSTPGPSWRADLSAGVRATREIDGARSLLALLGVAGLAYGASLVTHVVFVQERLGLPSSAAGYLAAASAVGGLLAISRAGRHAGRQRPGRLLLSSTALLGLPMLALSLVHNPLIAYLVMLPEGAGSVTLDIVSVTVWQRITPSRLLGRVYGLQDSVVGVGTLGGAFVAPLFMRLFGAAGTIAMFGAVVLGAVCVMAPSLQDIGEEQRVVPADLAVVGG